jgi:hypothetical protein
MQGWSHAKAMSAIEQLGLAGGNLRLACYWLSLWNGDRAPSRADFNPARVAGLLPGIALIEVFADEKPVCRLSGTAIDRGLHRPLAGTNLLEGLPEAEKAVRCERLQAIVSGHISRSQTAYVTTLGRQGVVETLQLPFFGESENGSRQYLAHINWRPDMGFAASPKPGLGLGLPEQFVLRPIH